MWILLRQIEYLKLRFTYTQNNYQEKFALTQTILYIKRWCCVIINFWFPFMTLNLSKRWHLEIQMTIFISR